MIDAIPSPHKIMMASWVRSGLIGPVSTARHTHRITETVRGLNHIVQGLTGKKGPFKPIALQKAYPELAAMLDVGRAPTLHDKLVALRAKWGTGPDANPT